MFSIRPINREENPRAETSSDILKRALEICPQLGAPPGQAPLKNLQSIVKSEVVGFRPTRTAGICLEVSSKPLKRSIPVIHNYGHGGKLLQCLLQRELTS
jgi:D-amino-acid oxidase